MPTLTPTATLTVCAQASRRWQAIDPLLPAPADPPPGCGVRFVVPGPGGQLAAAGTCAHWEGTPDTLDLAWGATRRFTLTPQVAGPDVADGLEELLSQWRDHLGEVTGTADDDTSAIVHWPSRDISGVATLMRHGLTATAVIAARTTDRDLGQAVAAPPGFQIRRAGPADLDEVVRLGLEAIRFDRHFLLVTERPGTAAALRAESARLLAAPEPWAWLAERDDEVIGMLVAEPPDAAAWIAPMTGPSPVSYLLLACVTPGQRGSGVGAALAGRYHHAVSVAAVPVSLLHYASLNPLSVPFWSQQGYRPLWASWEASPAASLR